MNAVEIEEAISQLAEQPFDADHFPYAFLEAFGNKPTTLKRLKSGVGNESDMTGAVLQRNNIHIAVCPPGHVTDTLDKLRLSPATRKAKAKFILATDGIDFEAEDLTADDGPIVCPYPDFPNHFGVFLALAGISTVKQIRDSSFDIRATSRLNRLYLALLQTNPDWGTAERRHDLNHFMARLIFCFFAEDTDIFNGHGLFTATIEQMGGKDATDTHQVISELFRAMNTQRADRPRAGIKRWADGFPYVNGGLFSGSTATPRFSKIARAYLIHVGKLDWTKINPDIFGSMIQAVADDDERGALGMHYTNKRLNQTHLGSVLPLTNFRGIELRDFSAEVARLALIIAEYQCDVLYRGQQQALAEFLPLDAHNWITCGNALRLDWLAICPPTGTRVQVLHDDLFDPPQVQAEIDFDNEGGETYICGNPPYLGSTWQSPAQKADLKAIFDRHCNHWKSLDYVAGWFMKAAEYGSHTPTVAAFVSTNSICQGQQVAILWPLIFNTGHQIAFAYTSFKWANLASHNAGVTVAIIGLSKQPGNHRQLFAMDENKQGSVKQVPHINAYLVAAQNVIVGKRSKPFGALADMPKGNMPVDGGHLLLNAEELDHLQLSAAQQDKFIRQIYGSAEFIRGLQRYCLWIEDQHLEEAMAVAAIRKRVEGVRAMRLTSRDKGTNGMAARAHQMREINSTKTLTIIVPSVSSESREYLPAGIVASGTIISNLAFALYDAPLWNMAIIASKLHWVWIATVCGKLKTDFRYSNTLGWNTFPLPPLTEKNQQDLTRCAEAILLAREAHFPATLAELYAAGQMPDDLRHAHERNDEVLERIYIGRRFKNDTERLEKLFDLYTRMTTATPP